MKEPDELAAIREAAELADAMLRVHPARRGLVGRTEREVALALEREMRERGAEDPSFPSIVAAAAHGALPHADPRDERIAADTLVIVDMGARVDGYCSDCTRTFATGDLADEARRGVRAGARGAGGVAGRGPRRARRAARSTRWRAT